MKTYGQFCPVAKASEIFCERWTPLIVRDLAAGAVRFSELQRGVPLASPTLLSRRLRQLEDQGIVERRKSESGRSWTYHLTPAGLEFAPIVTALGVWGQRWTERELSRHEMDLNFLLHALEISVKAEAFGDVRTVVQLEFADQPRNKRFWWFLNEGGRSELCVQAPDGDVNLYIRCSVPDMIYLWRGDLNIRSALKSGRLTAHGQAYARKVLHKWLGLSSLAHIQSRLT